ncbi:hypothetical protein DH2020_001475 [Rehmannia glutinosa]|uniref:Zinc knuckle CX2CX4HX4C domain-containing protein n=1 Tax=Rehmannia glutinosa TaxID=99300 RepID=A0ABR0XZW3_REHGL
MPATARMRRKEDMNWVLENQPWHYEGGLFAIKALKENEQPSTITIQHSAFWVRAYDIPIACINPSVAKTLVGQLGEISALDHSTEGLFRKFLRFKVNLDLTNPLQRSITIRIKGNTLTISLKYESLPIYCFCCGFIGPFFHNCEYYDCNKCMDTSSMKNGSWLKASPLKRTPQICPSPSTARRQIITKGMRWNVEKGTNALVWKDPWVQDLPNFRISTPHRDWLDDIRVYELMHEEYAGWNIAKLREMFNTQEVAAIRSIPLVSTMRRDKILWYYTKNGIYSVQSGYRVAKQDQGFSCATTSSSGTDAKIWRWMWRSEVPPPKIKIFLWKCLKNILPVKKALIKK